MKRTLIPIAATLAILLCTSAFAVDEPGMGLNAGNSATGTSTPVQAPSIEQETPGLAHSSAILATVEPTLDQLAAVRQRLATFEDVTTAEAAGYERFGDCMSGPQGAQGIHYRNVETIVDPTLDPNMPELLMYEPRPDGTLRLIGAEWIVFQQAWHDAGNAPAPVLFGREFSLNTTLLDEPFYALHLWAWHYNPLGIFANWNPLVQCGTVVGEAN